MKPHDPARRDRLVGYACVALVVMVWAGFSLISRYSARAGTGVRLTPWDLGALRFGVAFVVAGGLWLLGHGRGLPVGRGVVLGLLAGLGFALPSYLGFTMAPAAHGALILSGTLPFMVALGAWLALHERFRRARLVSLGLLLAGLALFGTEAYVHQHAPPGAWRGDLLFLCGSAAWAAYTILVRRWGPTPMQSVVAVGLSCGVVYLPIFALALPSRLDGAPLPEIVMQAVFQGLIAVPLSLFLFTKALEILGSGRVTTITALVPGIAAVLAVPLLGESLTALSLVGLALVCAAVVADASRQGLRSPALTPQ